MFIPRSLVRYVLTVAAVVFLVVGLNNCANQPTSETASSPSTAASSTAANTASDSSAGKKKININTAILSELDKLEAKLGIPALSNQIQAARPYGSIDDLVSKNVLSQEQFDKVKNQVTVEEIALTGEAKDVDYLTKLGLMKGHMIVAGQLLKLNLPKQAEPHLGHPVEEIYVDIQDQLPERNVPDFKQVLTNVQDLVKSKPNDPQVATEYAAAMTAIDKAIAVLPASQLQSPSFTLKAVLEMLDTAVSEYTAAISNGKISAAIEYQDSRGFVEYAKDTLFKNVEPKLAQDHPDLNKDLSAKLDNLFKAWPEPVPPATPVLSADQVASQVKAIEQATTPAVQSAA
jgi:DNA uptake protein ComE-like DNA-binding protein